MLPEFERHEFENIVEKVIVGGFDEEGNINPTKLVFVYKTGMNNSIDGKRFKPKRKNARRKNKVELYSHTNNEVSKLYPDTNTDTCRDRSSIREKEYLSTAR